MSTVVPPEQWGFEYIKALAKERRCPVPDLLALGRGNDPFYAGAAGYRIWGEWFARLWQEHDLPDGTHVRRVHYRLISLKEPVLRADGKLYVNDGDSWAKLQNASKWARHLGLLDAKAFEDRRNPDPHLFADYAFIPTPAWSVDPIERPWELPRIRTDLGQYLYFSIPRPQVQGYSYEIGDQPYHLEVWIEKSTMNDELVPVCRDLDANLVTSVGFQSITSAVKLLERLIHIGLTLRRYQPARIFYIADFDPAGDSMPVAVARQLEFYRQRYLPGADIKLTPLALTRAQVIEYRLPRKPIEKVKDPRKANFEEAYGEGAVELDALEALHPGVLARIVRTALEPYRDETLPARMMETQEVAEDVLRQAWDASMGPHFRHLEEIKRQARKIYERYRKELERLDAQLAGELAPLAVKLADEFHAIQAATDNLKVALPNRPEATVDPPNEDGWLFDSSRDYLEQLAVYKARRGTADEGDES
jgi:hypothetical protein